MSDFLSRLNSVIPNPTTVQILLPEGAADAGEGTLRIGDLGDLFFRVCDYPLFDIFIEQFSVGGEVLVKFRAHEYPAADWDDRPADEDCRYSPGQIFLIRAYMFASRAFCGQIPEFAGVPVPFPLPRGTQVRITPGADLSLF